MAYQLKLSDLPTDDKEQSYELKLSDISENHTQEDPRIQNMKYVTGSDRTALDTVRDVVGGAISGLGKGGQTIASLATGGRAPQVDFDELTSAIRSPNKSIGGNFATGLGEYLPYAEVGGPSLLGQLGAGAAFGAATTQPGESNLFGMLPSGKLGGAIESSLLNMLTHGAVKGVEALRPSKVLRGNLSPEELERNLDITKGTETGLGDVIQSPTMKRTLENGLAIAPFSGANESLQRTRKEVINQGESLMSSLLGEHSPDDVPHQLTRSLIDAFEKHDTSKQNLYKKFNEISDEAKFNPEISEFKDVIRRNKGILKSINLSGDPVGQKLLDEALYHANAIEPKIRTKTEYVNKKAYEQVKDPFTGKIDYAEKDVTVPNKTLSVDAQPVLTEGGIFGSPVLPNAKRINLLKGRLLKKAKMLEYSPDVKDRSIAPVYAQLGGALKQDLKSSVESSGNKELAAAYKEAEENYAKNFSGFLDKDIYKFISGAADPETLVHKFIKTSPNQDLASQLSKLASKIPEPKRNLLAYSYLSRALDNEGNLNPAKLGTAIDKLKPNQFKQLVHDDSLRKQLKDYSKLQGMNKEANNLMFNPKNGQRSLDVLVTGLITLLAKLGTGNVGALVAPAAAVGGSRLLTKALTSPSIRESLVKSMIENKPKFDTAGKRKSAEILTQSLAEMMNRKQ